MSNHQIQSEDEINLPGFKKIIKQFFSFLFWILAFLGLVLRKNKILVIGGLLIGLLLGYLFYISRPVYYKVTMVVQNNELSRRTYGEMIRQLNSQVGSGPNSQLAKVLNTSDETAGRILFLDARTMSDEPLINDTTTRPKQPFRILAGLTDNGTVDTIETLLINYLNNSPYLKNLREQQTRLYNDRLTFINSELQKLDSLKIEYTRFLASSKISATFYNNAFNPAEIYLQSSNLVSQREATLKWLYVDKDGVSLIDGFKSPTSPHSIGLIKAMLLLGAAGFLIAFLLGFLREAKKKLS